MLRCCAMLLLVSPSLQMVMQPRLLSSRAVPQIRPSLRSDIFMQGATPGAGGGAGEQERSRGRSAVVSKPKPKPISKRKEDVDKEPMWRVLLHNDDVHTWDYVIFAIVSVVKTIMRKKAHRITTQVGRSHPFPSSSTPISIRWRCHDRDRDDRHRATLFVSHRCLPSLCAGPHYGHRHGHSLMEAAGQAVLPQVAGVRAHHFHRARPLGVSASDGRWPPIAGLLHDLVVLRGVHFMVHSVLL